MTARPDRSSRRHPREPRTGDGPVRDVEGDWYNRPGSLFDLETFDVMTVRLRPQPFIGTAPATHHYDGGPAATTATSLRISPTGPGPRHIHGNPQSPATSTVRITDMRSVLLSCAAHDRRRSSSRRRTGPRRNDDSSEEAATIPPHLRIHQHADGTAPEIDSCSTPISPPAPDVATRWPPTTDDKGLAPPAARSLRPRRGFDPRVRASAMPARSNRAQGQTCP